MKKQQKKRISKYISWVLVVAVAAVLAVLPMIAAGEEPVTGPQASILSAMVERRDISTAVLGGGTLTADDAVEITLPAAVKLTEYLVQNGDTVTEGQPIATVDRVSVMTAITQVQETMEYLQEQLNDVSRETESNTVTASAGGTVKIVYAGEGEAVQDVMLRDGALAAISLDGLMAVQVERSTDLSGGDTVCVTLSDGTEVDGRVESNLEGILTVTVPDDDYAVGQTVKVTTGDGRRIGTGELYIHSQWNVVAYSGRISRVRVSEGDAVRAGRILFNLEDTGHTAEFETLSQQHRKYEALMLELFKIYQSETVTAPQDGVVTGVDENGAHMLSGTTAGWTLSLLTNAPNGDDETTYINYIGQVTEVGIDGLILNMNPQPLSVTDYKDLSTVPTDTALMTESAVYTANAPVYELSGGEWIQIDAASITAGDILLFAGDPAGNFVWLVRVAHTPVQPDVPDASEPTEPSAPSNPVDPSEPTSPETPENPSDPTEPADAAKPGSNTSQGIGKMPSFSGGAVPEDTYELYSLDTITVASVTAQNQLVVQITVDEWDISKIHVGQPVSATVNALSGLEFAGTVTQISNSGVSEGGNSKFTVDVTLSKSADMLPGMTAHVSITLKASEQAFCIPVAALVENGAETLVYTGYDEEAEELTDPVTVKTGISDGEYVQILSGLSDGETVYYPYYDTLIISNAPEAGGMFRFR